MISGIEKRTLLCRKEFYELLIRLAPTEFPDSIEVTAIQ